MRLLPSPAAPPRRVEVFVGGGLRTIGLHDGPAAQHLDLGSWGRLAVAADGSLVDARELAAGLAPALLEEVVLGPGLVLALAAHGVWCLHGSAIGADGGAVVFLGESGRGKSTLAARLHEDGFRRLADDVTPVELTADGGEALPAFPQLKLPAAAQPGAAALPRLPLRALYLLATVAGGEPEIAAATPSEAAAELLRHTVAARLFPPPLLRAHLDAVAELAGRVPVRRLRYPLRWDVLATVRAALRARHEP